MEFVGDIEANFDFGISELLSLTSASSSGNTMSTKNNLNHSINIFLLKTRKQFVCIYSQ